MDPLIDPDPSEPLDPRDVLDAEEQEEYYRQIGRPRGWEVKYS